MMVNTGSSSGWTVIQRSFQIQNISKGYLYPCVRYSLGHETQVISFFSCGWSQSQLFWSYLLCAIEVHVTGYTVRAKIFSNINVSKGLPTWYQVFIGTWDRRYFFSCGLSQRLHLEVSSLQKTLYASKQQIQAALTGTLGFTNLSSGLTTPWRMTKSLKPGPSPERKHRINNPRFNVVNMSEADNWCLAYYYM